MSCRELERLFLSDAPPGDLAAHRGSCASCEALGAELDGLASLFSGLRQPVPGAVLRASLLAIPRETASCEQADRLIAMSFEGEIAAADRSRLASHLSRCESCAAAERTLAGVKELVSPQPSPFLAARIAASRPRKTRQAWKIFWSPKAAIALAYAAAVVVMLAGFNPADLARKAGVTRIEESTRAAVGVAESSLADRIGAFQEEAMRKLAVWKGRATGYGRAALSSVIQLVMKTEPQPPPSRQRNGEDRSVPRNETLIAAWRA